MVYMKVAITLLVGGAARLAIVNRPANRQVGVRENDGALEKFSEQQFSIYLNNWPNIFHNR